MKNSPGNSNRIFGSTQGDTPESIHRGNTPRLELARTLQSLIFYSILSSLDGTNLCNFLTVQRSSTKNSSWHRPNGSCSVTDALMCSRHHLGTLPFIVRAVIKPPPSFLCFSYICTHTVVARITLPSSLWILDGVQHGVGEWGLVEDSHETRTRSQPRFCLACRCRYSIIDEKKERKKEKRKKKNT